MNTFYPGNDYRNYLSHARTNRRKSLRDHRVEQVRKTTLMPGEHPDRDTGNMNGNFHRPSPWHEDPEQQRMEEDRRQRMLAELEARRNGKIEEEARRQRQAESEASKYKVANGTPINNVKISANLRRQVGMETEADKRFNRFANQIHNRKRRK